MLCARMIGLRDVYIELVSAIRKHVIDYHDVIDIVQIAEIHYFLFFHAIYARFAHNKRHCCE